MAHRDIIDGWYPFSEEDAERWVAKGIWHNLTTCDLLDRNTERLPDNPAFIDDKRELTWKEVKRESDRVALWLHGAGVTYGDFFILQLPNVVEFFSMLFGLNRLGAIPVMCIARHRKAEVSYEIGLHQAKGIIVPVGEKFDYTGMVEEMKEAHPYLKITLTAGGQAPEGWHAIEDIAGKEMEKDYPEGHLEQFKPDPNDLCAMQLSGGTTGFPKGIPRTYNDYICQWDYIGRAFALTDETVTLDLMPVGHNASATVVWGPLIFRGATTVLSKIMKPETHFELIEKRKVTFVPLVPVQLNYWMESQDVIKKYDLSSLRTISIGAQKPKPEQVRWCLEDFGVGFVNGFGMAEGPFIATRPESPKEVQWSTIGRPIVIDPEVQFKIVDDDGVEVKQGEIGEMISKGPLTFKGYFRNEAENKKSFDHLGFFHSGDLMSVREDGRFVIEGRKKDMVIRGGENVYPEPVEDILVKHPGIAFAAVVGMPDPGFGERLCAFVQLIEGRSFTFEDMQEYLKGEGMAVFQWPERLEIVTGWPLTGMKKINKKLLRAYITKKLVEEGAVDAALGGDYVKGDKFELDQIIIEEVERGFSGTPD